MVSGTWVKYQGVESSEVIDMVKSEVEDAPVIPTTLVRIEAICDSWSDDRKPVDDCEADAGAEATTEDLRTNGS